MEFGPLECATIVFRALRRAADLDRVAKRINSGAFLRRRATDPTGLSVNYNCQARECGQDLKKRHGVATLHVGHIRSLELDVVSDAPTHANITGVPIRDESDQVSIDRAERLADRLAEQARLLLPEELQ
jgi:hypothetical protein